MLWPFAGFLICLVIFRERATGAAGDEVAFVIIFSIAAIGAGLGFIIARIIGKRFQQIWNLEKTIELAPLGQDYTVLQKDGYTYRPKGQGRESSPETLPDGNISFKDVPAYDSRLEVYRRTFIHTWHNFIALCPDEAWYQFCIPGKFHTPGKPAI